MPPTFFGLTINTLSAALRCAVAKHSWLRLTAILIFFSGCVSSSFIFEKSASWFEKTDPHVYFREVRASGRVSYLGYSDETQGIAPYLPGVNANDPSVAPHVKNYMAGDSIADPLKKKRFRTAVEAFARVYNADVLAEVRRGGVLTPVELRARRKKSGG